mmetsp:Transcript_20019/g.79835  ORF Transcript_20019/g.79835 Transcript_20019/m.79835 type:complete len:942 (+) Transcript_20019:794-3619(+)
MTTREVGRIGRKKTTGPQLPIPTIAWFLFVQHLRLQSRLRSSESVVELDGDALSLEADAVGLSLGVVGVAEVLEHDDALDATRARAASDLDVLDAAAAVVEVLELGLADVVGEAVDEDATRGRRPRARRRAVVVLGRRALVLARGPPTVAVVSPSRRARVVGVIAPAALVRVARRRPGRPLHVRRRRRHLLQLAHHGHLRVGGAPHVQVRRPRRDVRRTPRPVLHDAELCHRDAVADAAPDAGLLGIGHLVGRGQRRLPGPARRHAVDAGHDGRQLRDDGAPEFAVRPVRVVELRRRRAADVQRLGQRRGQLAHGLPRRLEGRDLRQLHPRGRRHLVRQRRHRHRLWLRGHRHALPRHRDQRHLARRGRRRHRRAVHEDQKAQRQGVPGPHGRAHDVLGHVDPRRQARPRRGRHAQRAVRVRARVPVRNGRRLRAPHDDAHRQEPGGAPRVPVADDADGVYLDRQLGAPRQPVRRRMDQGAAGRLPRRARRPHDVRAPGQLQEPPHHRPQPPRRRLLPRAQGRHVRRGPLGPLPRRPARRRVPRPRAAQLHRHVNGVDVELHRRPVPRLAVRVGDHQGRPALAGLQREPRGRRLHAHGLQRRRAHRARDGLHRAGHHREPRQRRRRLRLQLGVGRSALQDPRVQRHLAVARGRQRRGPRVQGQVPQRALVRDAAHGRDDRLLRHHRLRRPVRRLALGHAGGRDHARRVRVGVPRVRHVHRDQDDAYQARQPVPRALHAQVGRPRRRRLLVPDPRHGRLHLGPRRPLHLRRPGRLLGLLGHAPRRLARLGDRVLRRRVDLRGRRPLRHAARQRRRLVERRLVLLGGLLELLEEGRRHRDRPRRRRPRPPRARHRARRHRLFPRRQVRLRRRRPAVQGHGDPPQRGRAHGRARARRPGLGDAQSDAGEGRRRPAVDLELRAPLEPALGRRASSLGAWVRRHVL